MIDECLPTTRVPPWAWPTVLALDAPLVAVCWQLAFAETFGVALTPIAPLLLALSVWLVYSADRVLDSFRLTAEHRPTLRHAFVASRRRMLVSVWLAVVALAAALAVASLDTGTLVLGLLVVFGAVLYLLPIHLRSLGPPLGKTVGLRRDMQRLISRHGQHLQVGVLFAAGVALFAWTQIDARWLGPLMMFAALCALNCGYVECWEHLLDDGRGRPGGSDDPRSGCGRHLRRSTLVFATLGLAAFVVTGMSLYLAGTLGALALLALDRHTGGLEPTMLRSLADTALVVPLVVVPLLVL